MNRHFLILFSFLLFSVPIFAEDSLPIIEIQKDADKSWDVFNNDVYLQFTYFLPKWSLTVGERVMFYNYKMKHRPQVVQSVSARMNRSSSSMRRLPIAFIWSWVVAPY